MIADGISPANYSASSSAVCADPTDLTTWQGVTWITTRLNPQHWQNAISRIEAAGNAVFCPTIQVERIQGGRKRRIWRPLFLGYAFVKMLHWDIDLIRSIPDVTQIIDVPNQDRLIFELRNLQIAQPSIGPDLYPTFSIGKRAEIKSGPYKNFVGKIIERKGRAIFTLECHTMGTLVPIDIDGACIELLRQD